MNDLDELLTPRPAEPGRADCFRATTGVLRRRRWLRRGTRGFGLVLLFAAGAALAWQLRPPLVVESVPIIAEVKPAPPAPPTDPYRGDPPDKIERWAAVVTASKRSTLYRRAGDGYLERGDELGALRCYRQALVVWLAADSSPLAIVCILSAPVGFFFAWRAWKQEKQDTRDAS